MTTCKQKSITSEYHGEKNLLLPSFDITIRYLSCINGHLTMNVKLCPMYPPLMLENLVANV